MEYISCIFEATFPADDEHKSAIECLSWKPETFWLAEIEKLRDRHQLRTAEGGDCIVKMNVY